MTLLVAAAALLFALSAHLELEGLAAPLPANASPAHRPGCDHPCQQRTIFFNSGL